MLGLKYGFAGHWELTHVFFVHYRHNLVSSTSSDGGFNKITAHGENALLTDNF